MGRSTTTIARHIGKGLSLLAACFLALALGGCGGIEFQGKAFDYIGLSDVGKQQEDVRMTERAPLLVPPNTRNLPPPGSPAVTRADWPADTDKERKRLAALRKAEEEKKAAAARARQSLCRQAEAARQIARQEQDDRGRRRDGRRA